MARAQQSRAYVIGAHTFLASCVHVYYSHTRGECAHTLTHKMSRALHQRLCDDVRCVRAHSRTKICGTRGALLQHVHRISRWMSWPRTPRRHVATVVSRGEIYCSFGHSDILFCVCAPLRRTLTGFCTAHGMCGYISIWPHASGVFAV